MKTMVLACGLALSVGAADVVELGPDYGRVSVDLWEVVRNPMSDIVIGSADMSRSNTWTRGSERAVAGGCVPMTDETGAFVRLGGGHKGMDASVAPASPIPVRGGQSYRLAYSGRLPQTGGRFVVYLRMFDKDGRNVSKEAEGASKLSYSSFSKALWTNSKSPENLAVWQDVKIPFRTAPNVASVLPIVAVWTGDGLDCRAIQVTEHRPTSARRIRPEEIGLSLALDAVRDAQGFTTLSATVADIETPPRPRALKVVLNVERDLTGWTVHENWRADTPLVGAYRQAYVMEVGGHLVSRYPFTAVSRNGRGFAVGTAFDEEAFEGREVTTNGFRSTYPLGLLPRGNGRGTKGTLRWLLFPFEGRWGFRSAARAYYAHEGHKVTAWGKNRRQGCWIWPTGPRGLPKNHDDFGLTLWEAPSQIGLSPDQIDLAHKMGIQVYPYTEAWGMRQQIVDRTDGTRPSTDELLAELKGWAAEKETPAKWLGAPRNVAAQACLNSMPVSPDGSHPFDVDNYGRLAQWWRTNPDPRLAAKPNRASFCWEHSAGLGAELVDGVYLDSVTYGVVDYNNVRPEHLAVMDENLIWDVETAQPCANGMHHQVAFVKWLAANLHPKGKRIFGNAFQIAQRFHATTADVFGGEVGGWGAANGEARMRRVESDADAGEKRFFARHRPVSNLLQEGCFWRDAPELSAKGVENYVEHQMFYGFYPAVTTIGGGTNVTYHTWYRYLSTPRQHERDRAVFKKAIPLIRALNRAGWEPETFLRPSVDHVWVERYGSTKDGGDCYFTLRNDSDKACEVELTPEETDEVGIASLKSLWKGDDPVKTEKGWRMSLGPWATAVLKATSRTGFAGDGLDVSVPFNLDQCADFESAVRDLRRLRTEFGVRRVFVTGCPGIESRLTGWDSGLERFEAFGDRLAKLRAAVARQDERPRDGAVLLLSANL